MAEWRDFGATNAERTCLWCGKDLRAKYEPVVTMEQGEEWHDFYARQAAARGQRGALRGYGDYLDGFFSGLRCGYMFGVAMAKNDSRLKAVD